MGDRIGPSADAAARDLHLSVELVAGLSNDQRLEDLVAMLEAREQLLHRLVVDDVLACAGVEPYARDGALATPRAVVVMLVGHAEASAFSGSPSPFEALPLPAFTWASCGWSGPA